MRPHGRTTFGRGCATTRAMGTGTGMPVRLRGRLAVAMGMGLVLGLLGLSERAALASHYAVTDIPSLISGNDAEKLKKAGVATTEDLLNHAAKPKDRKALAKASGLSGPAVLSLARRCDLLRIKGVGPEMVLLLEAAKVQSTADLAKQDPSALTTAADAANKAKKITEKPPTEPQFENWIEQAKQLPSVLELK